MTLSDEKESKDSVAFKIMLEERDRLRAEIELLQAELVRRDQAHESVRGQVQGLRYLVDRQRAGRVGLSLDGRVFS